MLEVDTCHTKTVVNVSTGKLLGQVANTKVKFFDAVIASLEPCSGFFDGVLIGLFTTLGVFEVTSEVSKHVVHFVPFRSFP